MAPNSPFKLGLALALCFVIAVIQADEKCRSGCGGGGAQHTFKYADGTTYKYSFDSKIEVTLSSAEGQKTTTEVKADVLITQQPQCNQILRLQNVQIIGADGKKYNKIPDVDKPIRLNFHDGHIEDSICITPGDTQNSLNIKRAVASLLQTNLKSGYETDVFGVCPTEVTVNKEGNTVTVYKTRNLNKCAHRESIKQDFLFTTFNPNSEIRSSPLLNGDYSAKIRIKNGILDLATVTEQYLYVPFSVGDNGAKASVETKLQYVSSNKDNVQAKVSAPRSILFEDPHPVNSPNSNVNSILTAVKDTASTVGVTVGENTAKEFIGLIKILRVSAKADLLSVYNKVKAGVGFSDKVAAKKLFLDALLRAGTGDTIEVALELLKTKELSELEQKFVYLGLSMARHTTDGAVVKATELLNQANLPLEAYLGIGNLVGRHCRTHSCKNVDAITKLSQKFVQKLGDGKVANRQEENDLIYILKALANTKYIHDSVVGKISGIAQDKKAPSRLRVAALEAYLADPCKDKLRDSALNLLKDIQQDSEIRIKAYLALAQCPNAKIGNAVKTLLDSEPSYQVGGFIVSHIKSLRASSNPDKELAKQHLGFLILPKRFPIDPRKWSFNGELSYAVDTLGIAESAETNIIYSRDSPIPRSVSLNLTADVFGHTFNFLELQVRQENLERLLEHYIGPKGLLRTSSLQELWDTKGKKLPELRRTLEDKLYKALRARRDVTKAELDSVAKQVQVKSNELNRDLDLDYSIKSFGSEIFFLNVKEDSQKYSPEAIIDRIVDAVTKGVDKIKNFEETLRSNLLFLDAELGYPTQSGFPLRLGVEGSSNIQIKAAGQIDIKNLFREDTTTKLSLIPSANIEIAGRLTLDAYLVETGLKVISSLHTATGADVTVNLFDQISGLDVKLSLPLEKQDIVTAKHDIVFHTRELGVPEKNTPLKFSQNKDFSICLDQLSPIIGLTFCGDINGPNLQGAQVPILPMPLAGDAKISITIEREDVSQYHYRRVLHDREQLGAEVHFETIGQSGQKKVSFDVEAFSHPERRFKISLASPLKSATLEGKLVSTDQEKSAWIRFHHDNDEYYGKIGFAVTGSKARSEYTPILEYKTPQDSALQAPPYRVEGKIIVEESGFTRKYTFDNVKLINPKPILLTGYIALVREGINCDLKVSSEGYNGAFKGGFELNPSHIKYNAQVENSVNPQTNFLLDGELIRLDNDEGLKNDFKLTHGPDLKSKSHTLTIKNALRFRPKPAEFLIDTKNELTYPLFEVGGKFDLSAELKKLDYDVELKYKDIKVGSELEAKWNKKADGLDYSADLEIYGLNNKLEAKAKRVVTGDQSDIENSIDVNGKKVEVKGKIKHHVRPNDIDVGSNLEVKLPSAPAPIKIVNHFKFSPNGIDAAHKVTSGGATYADAFIKASREGNAEGSIKVTLKDKLNINGQLKATKGVGSGDLTIDLTALKRTIKADATFTVQDPKYNFDVNLYPVYSEDKTKKISISTHNQLSLSSVDSKNQIDFFSHKVEFNLKGSHKGEYRNGETSGEFDILLPNNHYFTGKLDRHLKNQDGILSGKMTSSLEHRENKNTPGQKVFLNGDLKTANLQDKTFDVTYQWGAEGNGKNINVDLGLVRKKAGDDVSVNVNYKVYGNVLSHPLESVLTSTYKTKTHSGNADMKITYGPKNVQLFTCTFDLATPGHPLSIECNNDLTMDSKYLIKFKNGFKGSILRTVDTIELGGKASIYAESPEGVIIDYAGDSEYKLNDKEGSAKSSVRYGKNEPVSWEGSYKRSSDKDSHTLSGKGGLTYGAGKAIKADVKVVNKPQAHEKELDFTLSLPTETFKENHLNVKAKHSEDNSRHQMESKLTSDGKVWTSNADLVFSEKTPSIDIVMKCPENKKAQILAKITKLTANQFGGELKLLSEKKDFILEGKIDANIDSIETFKLKVEAHCPRININKVVVDAQNKASGKGNQIQVTAKSENKVILQGSTTYTAREEKGKLTIEGSGSFQVKGETKSANFKYIRQLLSQEKNGEAGVEIAIDASLGNKAIDAEFKATNKQFRILNSYCEEKKQCAHLEVDVKTNWDLEKFNNEIEVAIDLRKLGLSHEFGLKAVTSRQGYLFEHTVDVHFQSQENSKYQYSLYVRPKECGVSLTTPKRIIALEGQVKVPEKITQGGKASVDIVFNLDKKNQPNQKTVLSGWVNVDPKAKLVECELKFTDPGLRKPMAISGNARYVDQKFVAFELILDIFAQANQKLNIVYHQNLLQFSSELREAKLTDYLEIKSQGLGVDIRYDELYEVSYNKRTAKIQLDLKYHVANSKLQSNYLLEITPKQFNYLFRLINIDVMKITSKLNLEAKSQVVDTEIATYGVKPLKSHLEIKNWNTLKFDIGRKDSGDKLQVNSGLIPGQIADIRAEVLKGGATKELFHATVHLDEANFLKSDYGVQSQNIQEFVLKPAKAEITNYFKDLKQVVSDLTTNMIQETKKLAELADRVKPNLKPMRDYYVKELAKIKDEIIADKSIQQLSELLHKVISAFSQAFGETFAKLSELIESIFHAIHASFGKVLQVIEHDLLPKWKEINDKVLVFISDVVEKIADVILTYLAKLSQIAEKYQPELKQLITAISEVTQDLVRVLLKAFESVKALALEQWQKLYNELKAMPIFEELKAQYQQFIEHGLPSTDALVNTLHDVISTLKDIVPLEEFKNVIDAIGQYIEKKLTKQPVDDLAALDQIIESILTAIKRVIYIITSEASTAGTPDLHGVKIPTPINYLSKLPRLVAVKFSPLTYLMREDIKSYADLTLSLVNKPRNLVPPFPLYGLIAQGQHIFTFDHKHLTFPATKCNYVLARDAVDGNFTIIGSFTNGLLSAITLTEGADSITLKTGGQVLLNNAAIELPTRKPNIAAYRNFESITLVTYAGARVVCGPQLLVCSVTISGFYHGRIRGLLGNGNNEPYDDFTIPNGKVVTSESEFGNAYKTQASCPPVKAIEHGHHDHGNPACDKLFGWESSLRWCYPFVRTDNFKTACSHGLQQNVAGTEHAIAIAYVAACHQHGIPIKVPAQFLKCEEKGKSYSVGDKFSVKTPQTSADIVLLIDTVKSNEQIYKEYVQPLVQQLSKELAAKKITDIEFHLVTYGGDNQWPSHVTVEGKWTFNTKAPNLKFTEAPKPVNLVTGCRYTDHFLEVVHQVCHDIKLALGLDLQALTYKEGAKYPFRSDSIKSIIAVTGRPCEVGRFYPIQILRTLLYRSKLVHLNLITPFEELSLKDPKATKDVVGFNSEQVFTVAQGKNRPPKASSETYKDLDYNDYCVDFTVQNGGNVFVVENFLQSKGVARKQFVQTTSHSIVEQFLGTQFGLDCECQYYSNYNVRSVCNVAHIYDKSEKKGQGKS